MIGRQSRHETTAVFVQLRRLLKALLAAGVTSRHEQSDLVQRHWMNLRGTPDHLTARFARNGMRWRKLRCLLRLRMHERTWAVTRLTSIGAPTEASRRALDHRSRATQNGGNLLLLLSPLPPPSTISSIAFQTRSTKRMTDKTTTVQNSGGIGVFSEADPDIRAGCSVCAETVLVAEMVADDM